LEQPIYPWRGPDLNDKLGVIIAYVVRDYTYCLLNHCSVYNGM